MTQTQGQLIGISNELVQRVNQLSQENVRLASRVKTLEGGLTKISVIVCGGALLFAAIFVTSLVVSNAPSAPTNQPAKATK
jgi:phosphatidylserine decarboxylase